MGKYIYIYIQMMYVQLTTYPSPYAADGLANLCE